MLCITMSVALTLSIREGLYHSHIQCQEIFTVVNMTDFEDENIMHTES